MGAVLEPESKIGQSVVCFFFFVFINLERQFLGKSVVKELKTAWDKGVKGWF